jgi:threonine/homoserine/homoserine lactone efflux protein
VISALVAGLVAGYGIAVPVGAIGILLIGLAARTSTRVAAAAALGVATADGCYALLAVAGGTALARVVTLISEPLRWTSAAVLIAIAVRIALSAGRPRWRGHREPEPAGGGGRSGRHPDTPGAAYLGFLGLTLLNPMTIVYFAALVVARQAAGAPAGARQVVFVTAAFLASASWQLVLAGGGATLGKFLSGPRGRRATALTASVLTMGLAIRLLLG